MPMPFVLKGPCFVQGGRIFIVKRGIYIKTSPILPYIGGACVK